MNEIDIFLELLDYQQVYRMCKSMKIPVKDQSNKEFNRIKLKQKLKSGNVSFNKFIIQNKDKRLSGLTENEYLMFLRYFSSKNYPHYKKFINFLIYFPDKSAEMLSKISENIKQDRNVFDFDISFDESDLVDYVNKIFNNFDKKYIVNMIDLTLISAHELGLIDLEDIDVEEIKNYDLDDFLEKLESLDLEELLLHKYWYLKTHKVEEPLYTQFLLNIYSNFVDLFNPFLKKVKDIEDYKEVVEEKNKLKSENKELEKSLKTYKNINKKLEKSIEENKALKKDIEESQKQVSYNNTKRNNLESKYEELMEDYEETKELNEDYEIEIKSLNLCFDMFADDLYNKNIAIVSAFNRDKIKTLYSDELLFIVSEEVNKRKSLNLSRDIKIILIERAGINSETIRKIKKQFEDKDTIVSIINANNDKELLEEIIKAKQRIMEVF